MPDVPPYAAVIFDLDGTLIDTEVLCNQTGIETCAAMGLDVSLTFFQTLAGIHDAERVRLLSRHTGVSIDPESFYALWDEKTTHKFKDGIPVKPGVFELLRLIRAMGLPMAIATSSRRDQGHAKIAVTGLTDWVSAIVTFDDVTAPKPAPDAFLRAAALLGVPAPACLAFEDSEVGAEAAWSAGLTVVQVPDIHPATGRFAHHIAPTLLEGARMAGLMEPAAWADPVGSSREHS